MDNAQMPSSDSIGQVVIFILIFKIFLQIKPLVYLEMNHEKLRTVIYCLVSITSVIEYYMIYKKSGSFCARQKFKELKGNIWFLLKNKNENIHK